MYLFLHVYTFHCVHLMYPESMLRNEEKEAVQVHQVQYHQSVALKQNTFDVTLIFKIKKSKSCLDQF